MSDPNQAFNQALGLSGNPNDDPHTKNLIERGIINPQDPAAVLNFQKMLEQTEGQVQEFVQPNGQGGIADNMANDSQSNQVEYQD